MATTRTATKTAPRDLSAEVTFLTRALKAPTLRESVTRLAERERKRDPCTPTPSRPVGDARQFLTRRRPSATHL